MINHGLSTGGLFAVVGMLYERYHTRRDRRPRRPGPATARAGASSCCVLTLSSIGLPGLNGFVGEFLILLGMFQRAWADAPAALGPGTIRVIAVLAVAGVVLGAWYMLWLVQRVFFGPLREPGHGSDHDDHHKDHPAVPDLSLRELAALVPLVVFVFWIGLYPQFFLARMQPTLEPLTEKAAQSLAARSVTKSIVADAPRPTPGELTRCRMRPCTSCCQRSFWRLAATLIYLGGAFLPARGGWSWLSAGSHRGCGLGAATVRRRPTRQRRSSADRSWSTSLPPPSVGRSSARGSCSR